MPFDATGLYWPSFKDLHTVVESIILDPGLVDASHLKSTLDEYTPWMIQGLSSFKKPNEASKKAIETETMLTVGKQKLQVDPSLRPTALFVSNALVCHAVLCVSLSQFHSFIY